MKITAKNILKSSLATVLVVSAMSLSGCAVRVAPAQGPVVVKKHRCFRNCQVHHPRRPAHRRVVVIRR